MNYNFDHKHFRQLLSEQGFTSEKSFFEVTNVAKSTFQNVKNGSCDLTTVFRLCDFLNCEISDLFPSDKQKSIWNESFISRSKRIAILSQRPGVGVTSFSANLSQMLERKRYKTLIVEIGMSVSFDILHVNYKNTCSIYQNYENIRLEISRHSAFLDSLQLTDKRDENTLHISDLQSGFHFKNSIDLESTDFDKLFTNLVKEYHYDYIIFACGRFPVAQALQKDFGYVFGPEKLVKVSDFVLVGYDSHISNLKQFELLIMWLKELNIETFVADFMRKKREYFRNVFSENNIDVIGYDQELYLRSEKERKEFQKGVSEISKDYSNVHILKQYISFFDGHHSIFHLNKSLFSINDSKLKSKVRNYKYQIKNLFDEIDAYERESKN